MTNHDNNITASDALIAEINRSIDVVTAEISARTSAASDAEATKRNRRFISAKAAVLLEAADIARAAAQELTVATSRVLDEVAKAEVAGLIVQEDFSITDSRSGNASDMAEAGRHAAAIQTAVNDLVALDEQVALRLIQATKDLQDFSDN